MSDHDAFLAKLGALGPVPAVALNTVVRDGKDIGPDVTRALARLDAPERSVGPPALLVPASLPEPLAKWLGRLPVDAGEVHYLVFPRDATPTTKRLARP